MLSSSRFSSSTTRKDNEKGLFQCTSKRCLICSLNYLQECKSFVTSNGTTWNIKCHITCGSLNALYFLRCRYCSEFNEEFTKLGKTDNLRERTNNHISSCRHGTSTDIFDNHVYSCAKSRGLPHTEPYFIMFVFMVCNDYNKLLNIERKLHLQGHDTTFKLLQNIWNIWYAFKQF